MAMGADEAIGDSPRDRFLPAPAAKANPPPRPSPASGPATNGARAAKAAPAAPPPPQSAILALARQLADSAGNLSELRAIV